MYKVFRLCNLPPTLLTLRYLAFQEVCIRYKHESTPHTAEFQQIANTPVILHTIIYKGFFRLTDSIFGHWQCSLVNTLPPPKPLKLACTSPRTSVRTTQECAENREFFSSVFYRVFLAVQDSSIGDIVSQSLTN